MIAYLDAGSGSLIVSAIVAGAAGVAVVIRTGWRRFVAIFSPTKRAELRAEQERRAERAEHAERGGGAGSAASDSATIESAPADR